MSNIFNRGSSNFDRQFNLMNRIFWIFFTVAAALIVGSFVVVGYLLFHPAVMGDYAHTIITHTFNGPGS